MKPATQIFLTTIFMVGVSIAVVLPLEKYGPKSSKISNLINPGGGSSGEETNQEPIKFFNSTYLESQCDLICGYGQPCEASSITGSISCTSCPVGYTLLEGSLGCSDLSGCLTVPWCSTAEASLLYTKHDYLINKTLVQLNTTKQNFNSSFVYVDALNPSEVSLINLFVQSKLKANVAQDSTTIKTWLDDEAGTWANAFSLYTPPSYYNDYIQKLKRITCRGQWVPDAVNDRCKAGTITPAQCASSLSNWTTSAIADYRQRIMDKRADDSTVCP